MGTFFPIAFLVDTSCSSFSEIQPVVEVGGLGEENFGGRAENLHPRACRGDGGKRSLF
jgi:hypothetical protein